MAVYQNEEIEAGPYSYSDSAGDGVSTAYPFSFTGPAPGYIRERDIYVYIRDSDPESQNYGLYTPYTGTWMFSSLNVIVLSEAPEEPIDDPIRPNVRIRRIMPKSSPYASMQTDAIFRKQVLNNSFLQQLYNQHEALDGVRLESSENQTEDLKMNGWRILNLGAPVSATDAAQKQTVDDGVADAKSYTDEQIAGNITDIAGVVPQIHARQIADGIAAQYNSGATKAAIAASFIVTVGGVKLHPFIEYSTPTIGKIDFVNTPLVNEEIDVTYYEPVSLNDYTKTSEAEKGRSFVEVTSASAANRTLFLDISDNKLKYKDNTGTINELY